MNYNAKNYTEQGGDTTHIGGKLVIEQGAIVEGLPSASGIVLDCGGLSFEEAIEGDVDITEHISVAELHAAVISDAPITIKGFTYDDLSITFTDVRRCPTDDYLWINAELIWPSTGEIFQIATGMILVDNNTVKARGYVGYPKATRSSPGVVAVGDGLSVNNGVISVSGAANQAASSASTVEGLLTDFNALLTKLKAAGLMAADA